MNSNLHPVMQQALAPFVPRGTVPLHEHWSTTGEGGAVVQCRWNFSSDGNIEDMEVWMGATNIFKALYEDQILALKQDCHEAAKTRYEEDKADAAIQRFIDKQEY